MLSAQVKAEGPQCGQLSGYCHVQAGQAKAAFYQGYRSGTHCRGQCGGGALTIKVLTYSRKCNCTDKEMPSGEYELTGVQRFQKRWVDETAAGCGWAATESFKVSVVCFRPDRWVLQKASTLDSTRGLRYRGFVHLWMDFRLILDTSKATATTAAPHMNAHLPSVSLILLAVVEGVSRARCAQRASIAYSHWCKMWYTLRKYTSFFKGSSGVGRQDGRSSA